MLNLVRGTPKEYVHTKNSAQKVTQFVQKAKEKHFLANSFKIVWKHCKQFVTVSLLLK
jgi:hypothetical protein